MTGFTTEVWKFGSAYLPADTQATVPRAEGLPPDDIEPADRSAIQRRKLALLAQQDAEYASAGGERGTIESAIRNYGAAFRIRAATPEADDCTRSTC